MRAQDPNLPHLRHIAEALGDLREHVVFVGGAVAGLLVTDPLADAVRATRDVDAVDPEDVLNIVDGREELHKEMASAPADLRQTVAEIFVGPLSNPDFANALPGLIAEPERADLVMQRLTAMTRPVSLLSA